jgi:hypothetical protein
MPSEGGADRATRGVGLGGQSGCVRQSGDHDGQYEAGVHARSLSPNHHFSFVVPLRGGASATQGKSTSEMVSERSAVLFSPSLSTEFVLGSGYHGLSVWIPSEFVERTFDALTAVSRSRPLQFELGVDTSTGGGAAAVRLLQFMVSEAERDSIMARSPIVAQRLGEAFVCALLSGVPHNHVELLRATPPVSEPRCVRRGEEYMEANLFRHIALPDLAAVSGVSVRTLSTTFRLSSRMSGCAGANQRAR